MITKDQKARIYELDEVLYENISWLEEQGKLHEFYFQEYNKVVIIIFSMNKGEVIRYHEIDKETGQKNGICIVGNEWSIVKKMMQTYKGKGKRKQKDVEKELSSNVIEFRRRVKD